MWYGIGVRLSIYGMLCDVIVFYCIVTVWFCGLGHIICVFSNYSIRILIQNESLKMTSIILNLRQMMEYLYHHLQYCERVE